tara:strand:- start:705 stop:1643 length:939 start_codon:yes stop_codon:yes gene_type:complete
MNSLKIIKNHFISSIITSQSLSKKKNNKTNVIKIFIIRFFFAFPFIRNFVLHKKNFIKVTSQEYFFSETNNKTIIDELINIGFHKNKLKEEIINEIINLFQNNDFTYKYKNPNKDYVSEIPNNLNLNEIIKESSKRKISHLMISFDQNKKNILNEMAKSNFFLSVAKNYLNSTKVTLRTHCYITNPIEINEQEKKDNAQYFHYDCDYKKFLKIFIYLTDVDVNSGPHVFIPFSHTKKKLKHLCAERLDDEIIDQNYKENGKEIFIGEKGAIIFEDTFGFHKGVTPINKSRALLILEYGIPPRIEIDGNEIDV